MIKKRKIIVQLILLGSFLSFSACAAKENTVDTALQGAIKRHIESDRGESEKENLDTAEDVISDENTITTDEDLKEVLGDSLPETISTVSENAAERTTEVETASSNSSVFDEEVITEEEDPVDLKEIFHDYIRERMRTERFGDSKVPGQYEYAIMDIDDDGKEELLIKVDGGCTADTGLQIYGYDQETKEIYEEYSGWITITVYDTGYLVSDSMNNHGRSFLEYFWPYGLCKYNKETDTYEYIASVDAWDKNRFVDYPDPEFPTEKDLDGDGVVYSIYEAVDDGPSTEIILDGPEYEVWCKQYNEGNIKDFVLLPTDFAE